MTNEAFHIDTPEAGQRLDVFLAAHLEGEHSRSAIKRLIESGYVRLNEKVVKAHHKLSMGDDVHVTPPQGFGSTREVLPEDIPLDIFYEDDYLMVINKACGMTVHPARGCLSGTLVNALLHRAVALSSVNDVMRPGIVHRLDKETSGLMVVAKDNITHTRLAKQFQQRRVRKQYVALVAGDVPFDEGRIEAPIGAHQRRRDRKAVRYDDEAARAAQSDYRVIKRLEGATLVKLFPKTGRTHQLRVHMAHLGHPILGDDKYGQKSSFPRLALHAQSLGFTHPHTRHWIQFNCLFPKEFVQ